MEYNLNLPKLDELDKKLLDAFPNQVVRKLYTNEILAFKRLPQYMCEFLINQHQDSDGCLQEDAIKEIISEIKKYVPTPREKEKWLSRLMNLKKIQIIDHFEVYTDLRNKRYRTRIPSLNELATVDEFLVQPKKFPELLSGGLWGRATLEYLKSGDRAKINICDFVSYQTRGAAINKYIERRKRFSTEEWINILIRTIGFEPNQFDRHKKLLYISRLIPLVEPRTYFMELGPPGTGKSHVYENLSFYSRLILGGEVTLPILIYNLNTKENGMVFKHDVICFDEINKIQGKRLNIVPKLQQIMASGHVERGDLNSITDVSFVFQGNLPTAECNGKIAPKDIDHFILLPSEMKDSAFLDRINAYIHGWEFERIQDVHLNRHLGLITNYFAEILHKMRQLDYNLEVEKNVRLFSEDSNGNIKGVSLRDKIAVFRIISGLLKLIYPHKQLTKDEWTEIVAFAIELRQNVLNEIIKIEPELFSRKICFQIISLTDKPPDIKQALIPSNIKIYINSENLLTRPIPYWVIKPLVYYKILQPSKSGNCQIVANKNINLPITKISEESKPLQKDLSIKHNFREIELKLPDIQKEIEMLNAKYTSICREISNIWILQAKLINIPPAELKNLNSIEGQLNKILEDVDLSTLKEENQLYLNHLNLLMESQKNYIDLTPFESIPIVSDIEDFHQHIRKLIEEWHDHLKHITTNIAPLIEKVKKILPTFPLVREELFDGKSFKLFAFDMNNLIVSFKKKMLGQRPTPLFEKIKNQILPRTTPYMAYYFASKNFEHYKSHFKDLPTSYNQWKIEDYRKYDGGFIDIDPNLTAETCVFIEKYHDQIIEFHLGSGDKDLHIVCEYAQKYKIPIYIHVVDEHNLSSELASVAIDVEILF